MQKVQKFFIVGLLVLLCALSTAALAEKIGVPVDITKTPFTIQQVLADVDRFYADEDAKLLTAETAPTLVYDFTDEYSVSLYVMHPARGTRSEYYLVYSSEGELKGMGVEEIAVAETAALSTEDELVEAAKRCALALLSKTLPESVVQKLSFDEHPVWTDASGSYVNFGIVMPEDTTLCPAGWKLSIYWSATRDQVTNVEVMEWPPKQ